MSKTSDRHPETLTRITTATGVDPLLSWFEGDPTLRFSPCGRFLLAFDGATGRAIVFSTETWTESRRFETGSAFRPDLYLAPRVASAQPVFWVADGPWSMETGARVDETSVATSAGPRLSLCGGDEVQVVDGDETWVVPTDLDFVSGAALSPNGTHLMLVGESEHMEIWDLVEHTRICEVEVASIEGFAVDASPCGTFVVLTTSHEAGDNTPYLQVRNLSDGELVAGSRCFAGGVAWSPDGAAIACVCREHDQAEISVFRAPTAG